MDAKCFRCRVSIHHLLGSIHHLLGSNQEFLEGKVLVYLYGMVTAGCQPPRNAQQLAGSSFAGGS